MDTHDKRKHCIELDEKTGLPCTRAYKTQNRCKPHYQRAARAGTIVVIPGKGGKGRKQSSPRQYYGPGSNGYRKIRLAQGVWVLEHRLVMEEMLGRPLLSGENIHHRNGDRLDNSKANLELWVIKQPQGMRVEDALEWAREIIRRYE